MFEKYFELFYPVCWLLEGLEGASASVPLGCLIICDLSLKGLKTIILRRYEPAWGILSLLHNFEWYGLLPTMKCNSCYLPCYCRKRNCRTVMFLHMFVHPQMPAHNAIPPRAASPGPYPTPGPYPHQVCGRHLTGMLSYKYKCFKGSLITLFFTSGFRVTPAIAVYVAVAYVMVVSVGDALGRGTTSDLMSSCFAGCSWCKCDLILFITGVGSAWRYLWVAVLALLVLQPLLVPNTLVRD